MLRPILAALVIAASSGGAAAQAAGDVAAGGELARRWCSNCHVVGRGPGTSPATGDAVPTFASVASMPSTTVLSLRAFLQTPHQRMPDFALSRAETDDLIAYILSLKGN